VLIVELRRGFPSLGENIRLLMLMIIRRNQKEQNEKETNLLAFSLYLRSIKYNIIAGLNCCSKRFEALTFSQYDLKFQYG